MFLCKYNSCLKNYIGVYSNVTMLSQDSRNYDWMRWENIWCRGCVRQTFSHWLIFVGKQNLSLLFIVLTNYKRLTTSTNMFKKQKQHKKYPVQFWNQSLNSWTQDTHVILMEEKVIKMGMNGSRSKAHHHFSNTVEPMLWLWRNMAAIGNYIYWWFDCWHN